MPIERGSTNDSFNELLAWLHPDSETAALRYETIRADLIRIFRWRGCSDPEGMADETIIRVTRKVGEMAASYVGSPAPYFFGVAKNLLHEYERRRDTSISSTKPEQFVLPRDRWLRRMHSSERVYEFSNGASSDLRPASAN